MRLCHGTCPKPHGPCRQPLSRRRRSSRRAKGGPNYLAPPNHPWLSRDLHPGLPCPDAQGRLFERTPRYFVKVMQRALNPSYPEEQNTLRNPDYSYIKLRLQLSLGRGWSELSHGCRRRNSFYREAEAKGTALAFFTVEYNFPTLGINHFFGHK